MYTKQHAPRIFTQKQVYRMVLDLVEHRLVSGILPSSRFRPSHPLYKASEVVYIGIR